VKLWQTRGRSTRKLRHDEVILIYSISPLTVATTLVLLFRNRVPYLRTPHPAFGHPLPEGERAVIIKKTALSLWERGNRAAVGESIEATTIRHRNCERQYLVINSEAYLNSEARSILISSTTTPQLGRCRTLGEADSCRHTARGIVTLLSRSLYDGLA